MAVNDRVEVLDGLRGFAALAVMWFHFTNYGPLALPPWMKASGYYGWLGVDAFFVISGFVIPYAMHAAGYRGARDAGTFLLKRLARLEPPYLATILLIVAIAYAAALATHGALPSISGLNVLSHLGYVNAFTGGPWLNIVFWSLAVEFQFYVAMVFLYPALAHPRRGVRLATLGLMAGLGVLLPYHDFVFAYLGLFALGAAAFQYRRGIIGLRGFLAIAAALSVVNLAAGEVGAAPGLVGLATALAAAFARPPRVRALAYLGAISYSVYLLHIPVGDRLLGILSTRIPQGIGAQLAALAVATVVTIAAAAGLHRLVEAPAQRLSRRIRYARAPLADQSHSTVALSVPSALPATPPSGSGTV